MQPVSTIQSFSTCPTRSPLSMLWSLGQVCHRASLNHSCLTVTALPAAMISRRCSRVDYCREDPGERWLQCYDRRRDVSRRPEDNKIHQSLGCTFHHFSSRFTIRIHVHHRVRTMLAMPRAIRNRKVSRSQYGYAILCSCVVTAFFSY